MIDNLTISNLNVPFPTNIPALLGMNNIRILAAVYKLIREELLKSSKKQNFTQINRC